MNNRKPTSLVMRQVMLNCDWESRIRKQLVEDVAHEIRTPISGLRAFLESIRDGYAEPSPERCDAAIKQIDRLSKLIDDLDTSNGSMWMACKLKPIHIQEVVQDASIQCALSCSSHRIEFRFVNKLEEHSTIILIDIMRFQQVIENILSNAISHMPLEKPSFVLSAIRKEGYLELLLADNGEGVAAADAPFIFERLYKADRSRTRRRSEGSGLGLSIARSIMEQHGGDITLARSTFFSQGCAIRLRLPIPHRYEMMMR